MLVYSETLMEMSTFELLASLDRLSERFNGYVERGDAEGATACHLVTTAVVRELERRV